MAYSNNHISDTAFNSYKSLTTGTDYKTNNNPNKGPITYKPKALPLAHIPNQSLIIDTDYTKNHHIKTCYFTHVLLILELKNMHTLLQPLPEALKILTTEFELYIRKSGMESIVAAAGSDPSHFITCIQSLNEKFMAMVKNVFNGEDEFHSSLERVGIANLLQLK